MTAKEIRDIILSFTNDVLLDYPDHDFMVTSKNLY